MDVETETDHGHGQKQACCIGQALHHTLRYGNRFAKEIGSDETHQDKSDEEPRKLDVGTGLSGVFPFHPVYEDETQGDQEENAAQFRQQCDGQCILTGGGGGQCHMGDLMKADPGPDPV